LENEPLIQDIYLVSKPHKKLNDVHNSKSIITDLGSTKLKPLIMPSNTKEEGKTNNIRSTLDFLLKGKYGDLMPQCPEEVIQPKNILLVCGSFFIMEDVREYFGI